MSATSYRFAATPPAIQQLPSTPGTIRPLSQLSTMTPAQILSQVSQMEQQGTSPRALISGIPALSQRGSPVMESREMTGPTAILASQGLTPIKTVIRTNPQTGEVAQYIKAADEMGNKCYVDISGTPGMTSVSESMRTPVVEVSRKPATINRQLTDLAALGVLASGVVYECGESGLCTVTRVENNVPVETKFAYPEGMKSPRMMAGALPILPLSYVAAEKKSLSQTLTGLNQKLRESVKNTTSESLKAETKTLADNTNALAKFQAARNAAIKVLQDSEKKIRDLLEQFSRLDVKDMTPDNLGKLATTKQELVKRMELEDSLEIMSQKLQSISPLNPELATKANKLTDTIATHIGGLSKPIVPVTSTLAPAVSAQAFNSAVTNPANLMSQVFSM